MFASSAAPAPLSAPGAVGSLGEMTLALLIVLA